MRSLKKTLSSKKKTLAPELNLAGLNAEEEILLADIVKKPRQFLITHPDIILNARQRRTFAAGRRKLAAGTPLAYLLGYKWFFGRKFAVNQEVLIPRPETELLVEKALEIARQHKPEMITDVGTGSGAIIASLRRNLKTKAKFYAIDISAAALNVARKNTKSSGIKLLRGSLLGPLLKILKARSSAGQNRGILICANLPYLAKKELKEPSISREPKLALYGGKNGGTQKIAALLKQLGGLNISKSHILLEINYNQAAQIKKLAKKYLPASKIEILKDLSGFDRLVILAC